MDGQKLSDKYTVLLRSGNSGALAERKARHSLFFCRWCLAALTTALLFVVGCSSRTAVHAPLMARSGMVVSADSLASEAGLAVLKAGGNAVDAAAATGFALAVTYPEAGNIGGGGFMVIRMADGRTTMIDFREMAPGAAERNMYLDSVGRVVAGRSLYGPLAAGVPGSVAGLLYALEHYGSKPRATVMAPAIELARRGFRVDLRLERSIYHNLLEDSPSPAIQQAFSQHDGSPYRAGDTLRQPDLAQTLSLVSDQGTDGFYRGETAKRIVAECGRGGGMISLDDLEKYRAVERAPVKGSYRGYEIVSASPPSSGGIVLLEMLQILARFDLRSMGHNSAEVIHLFAAAAQRAYADRSVYLGDPDHVRVPVERLISPEYAALRSADIDPHRATPSTAIASGAITDSTSKETTHYCVADRAGNVVAVTTTVNGLYGCKTLVEGGGFFLNNEMDDFVAKPGVANMFGLVGGEANGIAPGKRMLSSMAPTLLMKDGKPVLLLGARGGSRIPTAVAQAIINFVDFGMPALEAVNAPRVHHQWLPDKLLIEQGGVAREEVNKLQAMGYTVEETPEPMAEIEALGIDPKAGAMTAAPDSREPGIGVGF